MQRYPSQRCQRFAVFGVRPLASVLVLSALLGAGDKAAAQDAYHCIEELSDDAVSYRIRSIEESFAGGRHDALGWRVGWISGLVAMAGVQTAFAFDANRDDRPWDRFAFAYQAVGGAALAVGLATIPMRDVWGGKRIRRQPANTAQERRDKLRYATHMLERGAAVQSFLSSEALLGAAVAFGAAGGTAKAVKWIGKTPGHTALMFVVPPILGAGLVLSAPENLEEGWENYRGMACSERYYDRGSDGVDLDWSISPSSVRFSIEF